MPHQSHGLAGNIFSSAGMSADPSMIKAITQEGKPIITDLEKVKSFLQASQHNANFMLNSDQTYAQDTQPLRQLTGKNVKLEWTTTCESAYQEIFCIIVADIAVRPFDPSLKTIMFEDAGPVNITTSVFQAEEPTTWIPTDHASQ